jgi:CRISPR-associated protein Cas1
MRAVLSAGLTPALGLYHRSRSNAFALADDFIEVFRPAIDHTVMLLQKDASPDNSEIKMLLLKSTLQAFGHDGSTIPTVMTDLAQQFGRYCEGDIELLAPPIWEPREFL